MAEKSGIDWLKRGDVHGDTWNPWISCQHATYVDANGKERVHPGCAHCYAEAMMDTTWDKCEWGASGNRVVTSPANWKAIAKRNKAAQAAGVVIPQFPSLCDPFEAWSGVMVDHKKLPVSRCLSCGNIAADSPDHRPGMGDRGETICVACRGVTTAASMADVRFRWFQQIDASPWLHWILFTKRPANVRLLWPCFSTGGKNRAVDAIYDGIAVKRRNVSLYYSASNDSTLEYGAPLIVACQSLVPVIGISAEPLLGHLDLSRWLALETDRDGSWRARTKFMENPQLGHVIIGVESRGPMVGRLGDFKTSDEWWDGAINIIAQCEAAGVPVYMKQGPVNGRVSHDPSEWPEAARVRQFPEAQLTHEVLP